MLAVTASVVGLALDHRLLVGVGLGASALALGALALYLIAAERRLAADARVREAEHARLADQLITAEQDERRRLALYLHDTSVQSLSGIALMLDAAVNANDGGDVEQAKTVIHAALERHRATIRALRDLSFALEPVVLRDQGFAPALRALTDQIGLAQQIQFDVAADGVEELSEQAQAALYQIIREAVDGAVRRGPPTRVTIRVSRQGDGAIEAQVTDDAPGERRRTTFETLAERARTLSGQLDVEQGPGGGTTVRVRLPGYVAET